MNQKAISPLFKQAISAVKKQVDTLDTGAANIKVQFFLRKKNL